MKMKKLLSVALALVMVLILLPVSALAASYSDAEGHWAEAAIERWSGYGIVTGDERGFRPNDNMTRAEAAKVLCELFGLTSTAGAATFTDVPADAWYANYIAKANAAGILGGVGDNQAAPNAPLTRETFFVMFARGLGLKEQSATSGAAADGSSWANGYINALTDKGYVKGDGTGVNALANINRASVMSLLDQTVAQYVNTSGTTTLTADKGIVLVNAKNVTLTGTTNADVVIAKGASDGSVNFEKATINGAVTVQADNAKVTSDKDSKLASAPVVNGAGSTYTAAAAPAVTGGGGPSGPTTTTTVKTDTITAPDSISGESYEGDLKIAASVGNGDVTLTNVTVARDLIVEGGGSNSITLGTGTTIGGKVILRKDSSGEASQAPSLKVESGASVSAVTVEKPAAVAVDTAATTKPAIEAQADVTVSGTGAGSGTPVSITGSNVTVTADSSATSLPVTVEATATNAAVVGGSGDVGTITAKADVKVNVPSATVEVPETAGQLTITATGSATGLTVNAKGPDTTVATEGNTASVSTVNAYAPVTVDAAVTTVAVPAATVADVTVTVAENATVGTLTVAKNSAGDSVAVEGAGSVTTLQTSNDVELAVAEVNKVEVTATTAAVEVTVTDGVVNEVEVTGTTTKTVTVAGGDTAEDTGNVAKVTVKTTDATVVVDSDAVDSITANTSGQAKVTVTGEDTVAIDGNATTGTIAVSGDTSKVEVTTSGTTSATDAANKVKASDGSAALVESSAVKTKSAAPTVSYTQSDGTITVTGLSSDSGTLAIYAAASGSEIIPLKSGVLTITSGAVAGSSDAPIVDITKVKGDFYVTFTKSGGENPESDRVKVTVSPISFNGTPAAVDSGETGAKVAAATYTAQNGSGSAYTYTVESTTGGAAWFKALFTNGVIPSGTIAADTYSRPAIAQEAGTAVIRATDEAGSYVEYTISIGAVTLAASSDAFTVSTTDNKHLTVDFTNAREAGKLYVYANSADASAGNALKVFTVAAGNADDNPAFTLDSFAGSTYSDEKLYVTYAATGKGETANPVECSLVAPTVTTIEKSSTPTGNGTVTRGAANSTVSLDVTLNGAEFVSAPDKTNWTFDGLSGLSDSITVESITVKTLAAEDAGGKATVVLKFTTKANAEASITASSVKLDLPATAVKSGYNIENSAGSSISFTTISPTGTFFYDADSSPKFFNLDGTENAAVKGNDMSALMGADNAGFVSVAADGTMTKVADGTAITITGNTGITVPAGKTLVLPESITGKITVKGTAKFASQEAANAALKTAGLTMVFEVVGSAESTGTLNIGDYAILGASSDNPNFVKYTAGKIVLTGGASKGKLTVGDGETTTTVEVPSNKTWDTFFGDVENSAYDVEIAKNATVTVAGTMNIGTEGKATTLTTVADASNPGKILTSGSGKIVVADGSTVEVSTGAAAAALSGSMKADVKAGGVVTVGDEVLLGATNTADAPLVINSGVVTFEIASGEITYTIGNGTTETVVTIPEGKHWHTGYSATPTVASSYIVENVTIKRNAKLVVNGADQDNGVKAFTLYARGSEDNEKSTLTIEEGGILYVQDGSMKVHANAEVNATGKILLAEGKLLYAPSSVTCYYTTDGTTASGSELTALSDKTGLADDGGDTYTYVYEGAASQGGAEG